MGPRPFSHGNGNPSESMPSHPVTGFNGAATFQSRKHRCPARNQGQTGLASMGPRPFSHGNPTSRPPIATSTSSFNGAATFQSRKHSGLKLGQPLKPASMGPRPFSHGNSHRPGFPDGLQAASMGPRPFSHGNSLSSPNSSTRASSLQWGRDLSVTETLPNERAADGVIHASMGPRPFSHGNAPERTRRRRRYTRFNGAATFQSRKPLE